jgi:hypothetical protein
MSRNRSCLALLWLAYSSMVGCSSALCRNDVMSEARSPNGRLKAVVFRRDCGATTWWVTGVSILSATQTLSNGSIGNVIALDDDEKSRKPISHDGLIEVHLTWRSDRLLNVSYPRDAVDFHAVSHVGTVQIEYSTFDLPPSASEPHRELRWAHPHGITPPRKRHTQKTPRANPTVSSNYTEPQETRPSPKTRSQKSCNSIGTNRLDTPIILVHTVCESSIWKPNPRPSLKRSRLTATSTPR